MRAQQRHDSGFGLGGSHQVKQERSCSQVEAEEATTGPGTCILSLPVLGKMILNRRCELPQILFKSRIRF